MNKLYRQLTLVVLICLAMMSAQAQDVDFVVGDASGDLGDTISVDITTRGYTNVQLFNLLFGWDENDLEFVDVINKTPLLPSEFFLTSGPPMTGDDDRLIAIYQEAATVNTYTLPPTEVLMTIRFKVLAATCKDSRIGDIDAFPRNNVTVINGGVSNNFRPGIDSALVSLSCGSFGEGLIVRVEDTEVGAGDQVCVAIRGEGMDNIVGFSDFEIAFDQNDLTYVSAVSLLSPQGTLVINDTDASNGRLTGLYSYSESNGNGMFGDLSMFEVCFIVNADCEESTVVEFNDLPLFVISDMNGASVTDYSLLDGTVTVSCCDAMRQVTDVSCGNACDGAITLTPDGCMNVVSYEWSNNDTGPAITGLCAGDYDVTITYNNGSSTRIITGITVNGPPAIVPTIVSVGKVMNGGDGSIDIDVTGGASPYSYAWSNGANTQDISGLNTGSYTVTITDDDDCTEVLGPIQVDRGPSVSGVVQNVVCFGTSTGGVDLTVTGGSSPYTYNWSCPGTVDPNTGSLSGVSSGMTCTVTVTDAGNCEVEATFNIGAPSGGIQASAQVTDDVMSNGGGAIDLTVSGGWGGYSYSWSDGGATNYPDIEDLMGIFGGNYNVTITDAEGCTFTLGPLFVDGLNVIPVVIDPVTCFGGSDGAIDIMLINGSGFFDYSWSCSGTVDSEGNISGLPAGPCTVTVTDQQDSRTVVRTFDVPGPTEPLSVNFVETCTDATDGALEAQGMGGQSPYTYAWVNPPEVGPTISDLAQGDYTVIVTDSFGCEVMAVGTVGSCIPGFGCYQGMDVITPNSDGINDNFVISCAEDVSNRLTIYTRWGEEVISYTDYTNQWNGVNQGDNVVDEGAYFWVLEVNEAGQASTIYKGTVLVLYELR